MPLTVATPKVPKIQEYEEPFFKAPPSPDVSNLLETGTMVSRAQVAAAEEMGVAARSLLAGVLHKKADAEHGFAITAATRSIGELDAKLGDLNTQYIDRLDGTNTPQISDELSTKRKAIIEEHRTALKDNPAAYNFFERHLPSTERSSIKHFVDTAKTIDSNSAEIALRGYVGSKIKSVNPTTFIQDGNDLVSAALENTLIKPEDRPKLARLAREQLTEGLINTYLKDPRLAPGFIELMKSENKAFDSIDPNKPGEKVTFAEAVYERANPAKIDEYKGLLKTATTNTQNEALYGYLDTKYNISGATGTQKDFAGALKDLAQQKLVLTEGGTPVPFDIKQKMIVDIKEQQGIAEHQDLVDTKDKVKTLLDTSAKLQESAGASGAITFLRKTIKNPDTPREVSIEADKEISRIKSELRADATLNIMSSDYKEKQEYKKAINKASGLVKPELINQVGVAMKKIMEDDPLLTPDQAASKLGHDPAWMRKTKGLNLNPSATVTPTTLTVSKGAPTATDAQGRKVILVTQPDGTQNWEPIKGVR